MNMEVFAAVFQIAVVAGVLFGTLRLLTTAKGSLRLVFFAFATACVLLSELYWLVYALLRPDTRMPFAANEVCEWALFLLLGAALNTDCPALQTSARREMLGSVLFTAANTALWIAWSGEWVQDILTGLCFGYFLCCLTAHIKRDGSFSAAEWRIAGFVCLVLIAAQTATFFVPETLKQPLDLFCYVLLFAGAVYLMVRTVLWLRRGAAICPPFAALAWVVTTMYMSAGGWYLAAVFLCSLCFPLMLLALWKEATA